MNLDVPDFARLSEDEANREVQRQDSIRRDFNSRVRLTSAQQEFARAMILEESLPPGDRLADNLASQGRFVEASTIAESPEAQAFYKKAAEAIFYEEAECECGAKVAAVGQTRITLPKFRILKEIYSIKHGEFGYLSECSTCEKWRFLTSNPMPAEITDTAGQPNDLERRRV